ncbi:MAG TPA: HDIG domain-containing protein, partial [Candidatus Limnocylindrales bacterium]|nr:HDIG domain-containing protein [Candidatus Limnocylindrales bacterium]
MLSQRAVEASTIFTRRDLSRLVVGAIVLVATLTAILALDLFPPRLDIKVGDVATSEIVSPRAETYISQIQTDADREAASKDVEPVYDYTSEKAIRIAGVQAAAFERLVKPVDRAFDTETSPAERSALLDSAIPGLSDSARATLHELTPERWTAVKAEASRVLDATERAELKDSIVDQTKVGLSGQMAGGLDESERTLAAEIITPLVVPNSSYSDELTTQARVKAAERVPDHMASYAQNETIVRRGQKVTDVALEAIEHFGLIEARPDVARLAGWFLLASLTVGVLMGWLWRFRPELWHRTNAMLLIGLIIVGTTLILKLTAGRPGLPFIVPTAAAAMLLAILLDAGVAAVVTAVLAVLAGAVNGGLLELTGYILFGSLAGIVAIRRGDRLQIFVQAGLAVAIVNCLVVATYGFLGSHDGRGVLELVGASLLSAAGSAVAAVGTFAVLGSVFGILTVFQLLELANPSQPLLRRLLVETPGTYHHSLMVGNLAERAAEAIGADPLLTRVAAYYHDIGKLANPLAFIENQSGGENVHDQLDPETSAQILKQHVVDGIDIAYRAKLPKSLIAFIPQHHGTAIMSYFYAKAREEAAAPYGGLESQEGRRAAEGVDPRRYRHVGPKP